VRFLSAFVVFALIVGGCKPEAAPSPSVTLALLGDVMLGRGIEASTESFAFLQPQLAAADLALVNLESPLTDAPPLADTPYILCAPPSSVDALTAAGFDLLSVANNHWLDCGIDGYEETQTVLQDAGLGAIGLGTKAYRREVNGVKLSFFAFNAVSGFDVPRAARFVQAERADGAVVIVSMHWGAEYQSAPTEYQEEIAGTLAEAGAALIWGHHPHVLQPSRWVGETLVLYSLGNALFDQHGLPDTRRSAMVVVTLGRSGVHKAEVYPFIIDGTNSRVKQVGEAEAGLIWTYFRMGPRPR